jgi:hypothetical protein
MHGLFQRLFGTRVRDRRETYTKSRHLQFWCPPYRDSQWEMQHKYATSSRRTIHSREGMLLKTVIIEVKFFHVIAIIIDRQYKKSLLRRYI